MKRFLNEHSSIMSDHNHHSNIVGIKGGMHMSKYSVSKNARWIKLETALICRGDSLCQKIKIFLKLFMQI